MEDRLNKCRPKWRLFDAILPPVLYVEHSVHIVRTDKKQSPFAIQNAPTAVQTAVKWGVNETKPPKIGGFAGRGDRI